jgi:hypothetical protein
LGNRLQYRRPLEELDKNRYDKGDSKMSEKKSNRNEMPDSFASQVLTEELLREVNGGLISSANLPHRPAPPSVGPNFGDYADWYEMNAGFGATGGTTF